MIVDMFMFLLPFTPGDYLFVGHHFMTAAYMIMSLQVNRGGLSCLILMLLGESTSLFQNSWLIARELRRDNQVWHHSRQFAVVKHTVNAAHKCHFAMDMLGAHVLTRGLTRMAET